MHFWHDLEVGPKPPELLHAVVEIPKGSRNKYEIDKAGGFIKLDRVLYSSLVYPGDYGIIPRTLHDDGDPLDHLTIVTEPTFPGCVLTVRPIGLFGMLDRGDKDDKVLCVPLNDPLFSTWHDLKDLQPHFLREVAHFFEVYKDLEGQRTKVIGWQGRDAAHAEILRSMKLYADSRAES
ncbi:MAG: inorganic diphosphatase [Planctomycetes bacterium]|nr:inorganic diphosphatase [Planctomycetota bacterium]